MITVRRSDTGSYVLVHEPSQTVMVGDDLEATYARLQEHVRANPTIAETGGVVQGPTPSRRGAWLVGVGVLALLPFLWLAVLHYTLGRLVDELRAAPAPAPATDVEALRAELEELRQVVSRVEDEVGRSRHGPAPRTTRPRSTDDEPSPDEDPTEDAEGESPAEGSTPSPRLQRAAAKRRKAPAGDTDELEP